MPRRAKGLSAAKVAKAGPGRYGDGAGLYLLVRTPEAKYWIFRYVKAGRVREMGLGPASGRAAVSLADARKKARIFHDIHRDGRDPLEERNAGRALQAAEAAKAVSFSEAANRYIDAHHAGWRNAKHAAQWRSTLVTYVEPVFGPLPVNQIDTGLVLKVLEPVWTAKPETASRLRGRIASILDWAKARGYRQGENPAHWRGHLNNLLPARSKVRRVKHHAALPYAEIGSFVADLHEQDGIAARALEFLILTAARTGEVIGARWSEIDLADRLWIIPGERTKTGKEHRVPLSPRLIDILEHVPRDGDRVFELSNMAFLMLLRRMGHSSITTHGFRSSFRDWCAERTNFPSEVAEMALGHAVGDKGWPIRCSI
jgi:integrase